MSDPVFVVCSSVRLRAESVPSAIAALATRPASPGASPTRDLVEALAKLGIDADAAPDSGLTGLAASDDTSVAGDREKLAALDAIAPYVDDGGYVFEYSTNGSSWALLFAAGAVVEVRELDRVFVEAPSAWLAGFFTAASREPGAGSVLADLARACRDEGAEWSETDARRASAEPVARHDEGEPA